MDRLRDRYAQAVDLWREVRPAYPDLLAPFVLAPAPEDVASRVKLMVVGQETFSWEKDSDDGRSPAAMVDVLASRYSAFDLGASYRSTPLWSAADHLFRALNPEATSPSFLWSNLNKMDCGCARIATEIECRLGELALLQKESGCTHRTSSCSSRGRDTTTA